MGAYVYSVRTKHVNTTIAGERVQVYALAYLVKPWGLTCSLTSRLVGAAEATWDRRERKGLERPRFVYLTNDDNGKPEDGAPVYEWDGRSSCYDEPNFAGRKSTMGYLRKVSRKWTVEPAIYSAQVGTLKIGSRGACFHIRLTSPQFFEASKAVAWAKANVQLGEKAEVSECRAGNKSALERVAEPAAEVVKAVAQRLLDGPVSCTRFTASEREAVDALLGSGCARLVRGTEQTGGEYNYDLTSKGVREAAELQEPPERWMHVDLTPELVVFKGGAFGEHSVCRGVSSLARVKSHWDGYCRATAEAKKAS